MMKTTLESKPPGVRKAVVGTPAEARPGVRDYSGAAGGREKASAAARPTGGKAAAVSLLVALLWLSWCCGSWAQTTNAPGTRSNAWTGFSTNAPSTRTVAGTGTTTNSPSERSTGWIPLSPTYPLLNSSGEVVSPPGFWSSNAPAIAALGLAGGSANPNAITNKETRLLDLYGGIRLLSPSSLNYWMVTNDVDRERLTFVGEGGSEVSFIWSDGHEGLAAPNYYGGLGGASNLPASGVLGLANALEALTNRSKDAVTTNGSGNAEIRGTLTAQGVKERRVIVFDGDSVTAGDYWVRYFTNMPWFAGGAVARMTNFAVSSDGVGYGHPDLNGTNEKFQEKAIDSLVISGGVATATVSTWNPSTYTPYTMTIRSASVPTLSCFVLLENRTSTTFTFPCGLTNQTITDAVAVPGIVARYAPFIRPLKPQSGEVGYYIVYMGLNDGGRVYQSGDLNGLYNVYGGWANAYSNVLYCAHQDGFKTVVLTIHQQTNYWTSIGRAANESMNNVLRNMRVDATGESLVDYLVDWGNIMRNPYDSTLIGTDGLHPTTTGNRFLATEVDKALRGNQARGFAQVLHPEMREWPLYQVQTAPNGFFGAPQGSLVVLKNDGNGAIPFIKYAGSDSNGWAKLYTESNPPPVVAVAAGSGVSISTNSGLYTVSASGTSGGGGTNSGPIALSYGAWDTNVAINASTPVGAVTNAPLFYRLTMSTNALVQNPTGGLDGQTIEIEFLQDATGSRLAFFDAKFGFGSDITGITLTTTAGKRDYATFRYNATADKWYCRGFVRGY